MTIAQPIGDWDIGRAIRCLEAGGKVARRGWNRVGSYIVLQKPIAHSTLKVPSLYLYNTDGTVVFWALKQADVLTDDWYEITGA